MTQHLLTQILKVIRDLVMRNRPCYRDYLGTESVSTTVQIGSGLLDGSGQPTELPGTDASFTGFVLGETYTVTLDGVTADYIARTVPYISEELGAVIGTTTSLDPENQTYDGWLVAYRNDICLAFAMDESLAEKAISVSQTKTETVKRYKTKLLPEYLLPAFLRKNVVASKAEVQSAAAKATAAQNTADNAYNFASSAYTKADTASSTANTAKTNAAAAQNAANAAQTTANAAQTTANEVSLKTANPAKGVFSTQTTARLAHKILP